MLPNRVRREREEARARVKELEKQLGESTAVDSSAERMQQLLQHNATQEAEITRFKEEARGLERRVGHAEGAEAELVNIPLTKNHILS